MNDDNQGGIFSGNLFSPHEGNLFTGSVFTLENEIPYATGPAYRVPPAPPGPAAPLPQAQRPASSPGKALGLAASAGIGALVGGLPGAIVGAIGYGVLAMANGQEADAGVSGLGATASYSPGATTYVGGGTVSISNYKATSVPYTLWRIEGRGLLDRKFHQVSQGMLSPRGRKTLRALKPGVYQVRVSSSMVSERRVLGSYGYLQFDIGTGGIHVR
jgi:hypothetical protein